MSRQPRESESGPRTTRGVGLSLGDRTTPVVTVGSDVREPVCDSHRRREMTLYATPCPFQFGAVQVVATGIILFTLAACGSDPAPAASGPAVSAPQIFGNASIDPSVTPTGFPVTLTPTAEVELICGEPASVHSATDDFELLGLVYPGETGRWVSNNSDGIAVDACGPAPSSDPATYRLPDELAPGDYVLCRGFELDDAACATFTVVSLAESVDPDAVPLTTLSPEVPVLTNPSVTTPPTGPSPNTEPDEMKDEMKTVDGLVMRYPVRSDDEDGMAAEVRGVLEFEEGCLYLALDEIDERYPVLWPAATAWDADREVVVLPTGDEIEVGGLADGGGGVLRSRKDRGRRWKRSR